MGHDKLSFLETQAVFFLKGPLSEVQLYNNNTMTVATEFGNRWGIVENADVKNMAEPTPSVNRNRVHEAKNSQRLVSGI